jgi:crotonobetainyl-CoA:carnitine CoA-transferase CaiB-like acyl-CoA transferase
MTSGMNAAIGILLALVERERSGRGQFVDITLFDSALSILHPHAANWLGGGALPGRSGNAHPNIAPYETLPTARGELFLAVGNDGQFAKLCAMLGSDLAADPRFATNPARVANRVALREALVALLAKHEAEPLAARLMAGGVPAAPVLDVAAALAHPHTAHREMIVPGDFPSIASPVKLSRTPATYRRPPPEFAA